MEAAGSNERLVQFSFTDEEYAKLQQFFQDIWLSDTAYKVFMARRAFNLNFVFMHIENAQYKDEYKTENVMSNTALLLCAEEIADYYRLTGRFPKIILADDLIIHGRAIMKLINDLERLIIKFLQKSRTRDVSKQAVHSKLLSAISIYVFALNADGTLLDQRLISKAVMRLPTSELKPLSQKISMALQQYGAANTSYVLSAQLPWSFCRQEYGDGSDSDGGEVFQYRGNRLHYYYRNSGNKILETVRVYYSSINQSMNCIATSLVIFGDVPYEKDNSNCAFHALCRDVAEEIREIIPCSRIADILSYEQRLLARPRVQMLSYLLSMLGYSSFYREKVSADPQLIYKALHQSDCYKIAANFDRPKRLQSDIIRLFSYISQSEDFRLRIFRIVEDYVGLLNAGAGIAEETGNYQTGKWRTGDRYEIHRKSEEIYETAEDIFYEVGMNAERAANYYTQTREKFPLSKLRNDSICLEQYLSIMKQYGVDEIPSIGCVLSLMDSGLLSMNLELDHSLEAVQCILKAGELCTFVLPRRFSVLIPALSMVEREYLKKGSSKKAVMGQFIDYLQEHCYQEGDVVSKEDKKLLNKLSWSKSALLYMYAAGQNFQDWDVNLLTNEDRLSHGMDKRGNFSAERYVFWTLNERKRIRYYNYCAKAFLCSEDIM